MSTNFNPVETWLFYGLTDLYAALQNQDNDVYEYGTFLFIMAAEKHLKAVLIYEHKSDYDGLSNVKDKKIRIENILKRNYSHDFKSMISRVSEEYQKLLNSSFLKAEYSGYATEKLVQVLEEGYTETRYPSVESSARNFPLPNHNGAYHDPLGSSFFYDFTKEICRGCWNYLSAQGINTGRVSTKVRSKYQEYEGFHYFNSSYFSSIT